MTDEDPAFAEAFEHGTVRGVLHHPPGSVHLAMVLTHGAGTNADSVLLKTVAAALAAAGVAVLRYDLPFRQRRRTGPPHPSSAAADRSGLQDAAAALKAAFEAPVILAGHSYGGRQASMLAAEQPSCCCALLLLSYPLHPPSKPEQLRTAHFTSLRTPVVFVHGASDPFGSESELRTAISIIPAWTQLCIVPGAGHELHKGRFDLQAYVVNPLQRLESSETIRP